MKALDVNNINMFKHVCDLAEKNPDRFPQGSYPQQLLAELVPLTDQLRADLSNQDNQHHQSHHNTVTRASARAALIKELRSIRRTAGNIERSKPNFQELFLLNVSTSDEALLNTAHTFAAQASANAAEFIKFGKQADFVDHLQQLMMAFDQSIDSSVSASNDRVSSTATINDRVQRGLDIVHDLDTYINNQIDDRVFLAAWKSASHVERVSRQSPTPATEPAPTKEPATEKVKESAIEPAKS